MRVIKDNNTPWKKTYVCLDCGSTLEVAQDDLKVVNTAVAYAGETWDPIVVFYCPLCKSRNNVTTSIPSRIRYEMEAAARSKYFGRG